MSDRVRQGRTESRGAAGWRALGRMAAAIGGLAVIASVSVAAQPDSGGLAERATKLRRLSGETVVLTPRAEADCTGGLVYDDGSFEGRINFGDEPTLDMVMRFDLPENPIALNRLCVCFSRTGGSSAIDFDLLVYADDGPGSSPGTILTGVAGLRAEGIPPSAQGAFYGIDLSVLGLELDRERVFIGPAWDTLANPEVFLCGDENSGAVRPMFASTDQGGSWEEIGIVFPQLDALGVRAVVGDDTGGGPCVADDFTHCLNGGRFRVTMEFATPQGGGGMAQAGALTDDTGYFYFTNPANVEAVVKVITGCPVNQHYWVFAGGLTDVFTRIRVTDTVAGITREYENPQGDAFRPLQENRAFATCDQ